MKEDLGLNAARLKLDVRGSKRRVSPGLDRPEKGLPLRRNLPTILTGIPSAKEGAMQKVSRVSV